MVVVVMVVVVVVVVARRKNSAPLLFKLKQVEIRDRRHEAAHERGLGVVLVVTTPCARAGEASARTASKTSESVLPLSARGEDADAGFVQLGETSSNCGNDGSEPFLVVLLVWGGGGEQVRRERLGQAAEERLSFFQCQLTS